jgi:hypothetical protein
MSEMPRPLTKRFIVPIPKLSSATWYTPLKWVSIKYGGGIRDPVEDDDERRPGIQNDVINSNHR